jgi:FG-GAP-like repeat
VSSTTAASAPSPSKGGGFNSRAPWSSLAFNGTAGVFTGDVDGDGRADLVAVNYNGSTGSTWVMTAKPGGGYSAPVAWSTQPFSGNLGMFLADVNGDGRADLVAINYDSSTNTGSTWVMLANPGGGFAIPALWSNQPFYGGASLLNGDGRADLVAVNYSGTSGTGSTWVMTAKAGGGFNNPALWSNQPFFGNGPGLFLADVTGDGRADLVAVNYAGSTGSTWVMAANPGGGFGAPTLWSNQPFSGSYAMFIGDIDGDGRADLVALNYNSSSNTGSTWVMTSTGGAFGTLAAWSSQPFAGTRGVL